MPSKRFKKLPEKTKDLRAETFEKQIIYMDDQHQQNQNITKLRKKDNGKRKQWIYKIAK